MSSQAIGQVCVGGAARDLIERTKQQGESSGVQEHRGADENGKGEDWEAHEGCSVFGNQ
jgi:hypothetical protein